MKSARGASPLLGRPRADVAVLAEVDLGGRGAGAGGIEVVGGVEGDRRGAQGILGRERAGGRRCPGGSGNVAAQGRVADDDLANGPIVAALPPLAAEDDVAGARFRSEVAAHEEHAISAVEHGAGTGDDSARGLAASEVLDLGVIEDRDAATGDDVLVALHVAVAEVGAGHPRLTLGLDVQGGDVAEDAHILELRAVALHEQRDGALVIAGVGNLGEVVGHGDVLHLETVQGADRHGRRRLHATDLLGAERVHDDRLAGIGLGTVQGEHGRRGLLVDHHFATVFARLDADVHALAVGLGDEIDVGDGLIDAGVCAAAVLRNGVEGGEKARVEGLLSRSLANVFAVAEGYPDLKANQNFLDLQQKLSEIEDQIQLARRYYNGTVRNLNIQVESFPSNIVARYFNFTQAEFFEIEDEAERALPKVAFS